MPEVIKKLETVRERIRTAAMRAGRRPEDITLVAVTKAVKDLKDVEEIVAAGVLDIGENRVQEAEKKFQALSRFPQIRWHMIGHLQTNKVKSALKIFNLIHSVDSLRLAEEIDRRAEKKIEILIEVKTSEEESKYGVSPADLPGLIDKIAGLDKVKLSGLMTMAPFFDDPERSRPYFRKLRELSQSIKVPGIEMKYLSMGMSQDFEVAIEEGSNIVRIGRAIF